MIAGRSVGPAVYRDPLSSAAATELLSALIAIPSINPAFELPETPRHWYGEQAMAEFVHQWLTELGFDAKMHGVMPGRPNVVATLKGSGTGHLLWEAHTDTVQVAGMSVPPFEATCRNGNIFGRGAVDDKGCLAAFMLALAALRDDAPKCSITLLAAADEEADFRGILHHLEQFNGYDAGIAGEPTGLRLFSACKGVIRWNVHVLGRAAHSSTPQSGVDALTYAMELAKRFRAVAADAPTHPTLGDPTLVCTALHAGEGPNTVPARADLRFEYRYLPTDTGEGAWERFLSIAKGLETEGPEELQMEMCRPFIDSAAQDVSPNEPVARVMQRVCREFGVDPALKGASFGSDSSKMCHFGVPTLIFGPGHIEQAHSSDEHVAVGQIVQAANMLIAMVKHWGT